MSTAGLNPAASAASSAPVERSEGVWHAAWRRFKADRVGLVSALVVLAFLLLVLLASLGLVAKNWQAERSEERL
jgi:peptide/nickel transport system permease protein